MAKTTRDILKGGLHLSDGGWGSELMKRGLVLGDCPEIWNADHADRVADVAKAYVDAGSDIILTNTFGGNRFILQKHNLENKVADLNRAGVAVSKKAAAGRALVFASMGPTGKMVTMGEITPDEAYAAFHEQASAMSAAGVDGIAVETMSDLEEFTRAVRAAKETGLPVAACMSFDSGPNRDRTMMGITVAQMVEAAETEGADLIGANCGVGIEEYLVIAQALMKLTRKPIWIKANAGLPQIENGKTVYRMDPETFARHARELVKTGVRVIGGCCGTTPEHIRALRKAVI